MKEQLRIVRYLDELAGQVAALGRPDRIGVNLQSETAAALDALLPSVFDRTFKDIQRRTLNRYT